MSDVAVTESVSAILVGLAAYKEWRKGGDLHQGEAAEALKDVLVSLRKLEASIETILATQFG